MFFNKSPHPANFTFGSEYRPDLRRLKLGLRERAIELDHFEGGISRLRIAKGEAIGDLNLIDLHEPVAVAGDEAEHLVFDTEGRLHLGQHTGAFGVSGESSLFSFSLPKESRYFGMGEKNLDMQELSGYRTKFYNTDVWSDFPAQQWGDSPTDPSYFTTPYLAAKVGEGEWIGFLLHTPWPTFFETPGKDLSRVFVSWQETSPELVLGAEDGDIELWTLRATSLRELTQKLAKLVGTTPLPPMWALGYHQSRWGYGGHDDLLALDQNFQESGVPCSALWLDLDYMRGYRIFTVEEGQFPQGVQATADALAAHGRRMVPIIDPGMKWEPGAADYEEALAGGHLCQNPEGEPFVGLVWPGKTVFPDFIQASTREWWSTKVASFRELGFGAAWIDMNDPSTGPVDPTSMLFQGGTEPHGKHRNHYSLAMQEATIEGFLKHAPDERPFLLSRSGFVGSSRYSAIWTGDNVSNRFYLGLSIPTGIGMSLSGLPFHGMDVGGFGGDVTDELMEDWIKLSFLFPLFRNHANNGTRPQEPFNFPKPTMEVVRRYIRLRYKLLPYLYALWNDQESSGEPPLRPFLYAYEEEGYEKLDREFLIGDEILQAPFVKEEKTRTVTLPGEKSWFETDTGMWHAPGEMIVRRRRFGTPLFVREGALIPMQPGTPKGHDFDMRRPAVHVYIPEGWSGESQIRLIADDGISFGYRRGERSELSLTLVAAEGNVAVETTPISTGFGEIVPTLVFHSKPRSLRLGGQTLDVQKSTTTLTDRALPVWTASLG